MEALNTLLYPIALGVRDSLVPDLISPSGNSYWISSGRRIMTRREQVWMVINEARVTLSKVQDMVWKSAGTKSLCFQPTSTRLLVSKIYVETWKFHRKWEEYWGPLSELADYFEFNEHYLVVQATKWDVPTDFKRYSKKKLKILQLPDLSQNLTHKLF